MVSYVSVGLVVVTLALTGFFATTSQISLRILRGLKFYVLLEGLEDKKRSAHTPTTGSSRGHGSAEREANTGERLRKSRGGKKPTKKEKEKEKGVLDEDGARILRIKMEDAQLEGRKYFKEYDGAVIYSLLGLVNFAAREVLHLAANSALAKELGWAEALAPDDKISCMVSLVVVFKLSRLLAEASYDHQLARKSERLVNWIWGIMGFLLAVAILVLVPTEVIDFGIDEAVVDAGTAVAVFMEKKGMEVPRDVVMNARTVKIMLATTAAVFSSVLAGPALRNAKASWGATDHVRRNISMLKRSSLTGLFLNLAVVLPLLATMVWVKPIFPLVHPALSQVGSGELHTYGESDEAQVLGSSHAGHGARDAERAAGVDSLETAVIQNWQDMDETKQMNENGQMDESGQMHEDGQMHENRQMNDGVEGALGGILMSREYDWAEGWVVSEDVLGRIQLWGLLLVGLLQISLLRVNLQTYCDGSVLLWYEGVHQSKACSPEINKAKIFLNNYFVCRIALQSLVPGVLVVLMIGLARTRGRHLDSLVEEGKFFFAPSFVRAITHFVSWWLVFMPAVQSWIVLALFRVRLVASTI